MPVKLTPAFKQWFGDSYAVDDNDQPLTLYHGTGKDITVFEQRRTGGGKDKFKTGLTVWLTDDKRLASDYAMGRIQPNKKGDYPKGWQPNVMPLYASIQNPMLFDAKGGNFNAIEMGRGEPKKLIELSMRTDGLDPANYRQWSEDESTISAETLATAARRLGYDALIVTNVYDRVFENAQDAAFAGHRACTSFAVFKSEQLKSAITNNSNYGNFNAANPDIRFSMPELPNQTGADASANTEPARPSFRKKNMTSATSDVNVTMSFRQVSSVSGKKAQYVFDIYRLDPPLKKSEDMKRTVVGSVVYYAGLEEPVLTQYYPSVCQLDRDRIISVARPGSSGGVCDGALKWSPVESDADGAEDEPDSSTADSGTGAPCP